MNKSYFSTDKIKLKKTSLKRNSNKNNLIMKGEKFTNLFHTKVRTSINQVNKSENLKQNVSLNIMNRKKSLSFNSICLTKKKKFKIKSKSKIITYKSSNELIKSNSGSRSRLYIGEIYSGNNSNENLSNNLLNMDKKCHYTIRKYV